MLRALLFSPPDPPALFLQVATTAISCSGSGVNSTISFIDKAGRILGANVVALGVDALQSVLYDPLTAQYGLTLVNMVAFSPQSES